MSKSDTSTNESDQTKTVHNDPPTILEWTTRLIGALLIILLFGYLVAHGFDDRREAAFDFKVDADNAESSEDLWRTPVTVTNSGGRGAAELRVSIDVPGTEQSFTVLIPRIGSGENYDLTLFLERDPRQALPILRVESYQ